MNSLIVAIIVFVSQYVVAKDLYCVSSDKSGAKVKMKISRLPNDLNALLDSLPQLKNDRSPASGSSMDEIMEKFFSNDTDYTFSIRLDQSKYDDVIVKGLLGGRWNATSSIAFITDPKKSEKIIKFQLAMEGLKGTLDYKGSRGTLSKHSLNCSHEALF